MWLVQIMKQQSKKRNSQGQTNMTMVFNYSFLMLKAKKLQTRLEECFGGTIPASLSRSSQMSEEMEKSGLPAAIVFYKIIDHYNSHLCGCKYAIN